MYAKEGETSMAPAKCASPRPAIEVNWGNSDKATFIRKVAE